MFQKLISLFLLQEPGVVLVDQEMEVPVTLSQVLRQVKLWTQALDSGSENVSFSISLILETANLTCSDKKAQTFLDQGVAIGLDCESDCMCLTKIVTHLVISYMYVYVRVYIFHMCSFFCL